MKQKDLVHVRRVIRRFDGSACAVIQPRQTLREIVDCMLLKKPFNNQLRTHQALPPDGDDMEDWDVGTREVSDLADLALLNSEVEAAQQKINDAKVKVKEQSDKKAFDDAVNAEIAKRQSASSDL